MGLSRNQPSPYNTPEEKLRWIKTQANVFFPMFGTLLSYCRFKELLNAPEDAQYTMRALPNGTLLYDRNCVDVMPEKYLLPHLVHAILHEGLQERHRASTTNVVLMRPGFENSINKIMEAAGLALPPGFFRETQWDDKAPEECIALVDPGFSAQEAIDMCPVKYPLWTTDAPHHDGEENEGDAPFGGTILSAAVMRMREIAKDIGIGSSAIDLAIGKLLAPQLSWEQILLQWCRQHFGKKGRSYRRPKRRSFGIGVLLAGPDRGLAAPVLLIDLSGSVVGDPGLVEEFMTEVFEIARIVDTKIRVIFHGWDVMDDFETDDPEEVIRRLKDCGGTSFVPAFEHIMKFDKQPKCVIHMTDCYGQYPEIEPNWPVLTVVGDDHDMPPWGTVLEVKQRREGRKAYFDEHQQLVDDALNEEDEEENT